MSVAMAGTPISAALCAIATKSSSGRGLIVGIPRPPAAFRNAIPSSKKSGIGPSPVKASVPAFDAPQTRAYRKSLSSIAFPMFTLIPANGAVRMGIDSRSPKKS